MSLQAFDEKIPIWRQRQLNSGNSTASYAVWGPFDYATRIDNIFCAQNDSIVHAVQIALATAGSPIASASGNVPAQAGFLGNPAVDLIQLAYGAGFGGLVVPIGAQLNVNMVVAMVGGSETDITLMGGAL